MKKIVSIIILLLISKFILAQKIGYVNSNEVFQLLPETKILTKEFNDFQNEYREQLNFYVLQYNKKDSTFQADSLKYDAIIKRIKQRDLLDLLNKVKSFETESKNKIKEKQESLTAIINKKVIEIINLVAKENNYSYIFEKSNLIVAPPGNDLINLIKEKITK